MRLPPRLHDAARRGPVRSLHPGHRPRRDAAHPPRRGLRLEAPGLRPPVPHPHGADRMEGILMETRKVPTYIEGLDETLGGGLPAGHVILLSGLPGTMKSSLAYAILLGNARERGAKGLYVTLEQTRKSLEAQMA